MLEKIFKLSANNTNVKTEFIGGITTFITMSYIIFVNPVILGSSGMNQDSVFLATCLSIAFSTILMGFCTNYPIALAPAMGHNFYFSFIVCLGMGVSWQTALGANFIAAIIFILLSFVGLREHLVNAIPISLKSAIVVGIGLLMTVMGLEWAGIIVSNKGTLIGLGNLKSPIVLFSLFGLTITSILMALRIRAAILIGILINIVAMIFFDFVKFNGIFSKPPSMSATLFKLDIFSACTWEMVGVIFTFFFLDLFDTVGTLIGVTKKARIIKNNKLPKAKQALLSDAISTCVGTVMGTSSVTAYIESSAGIASGARTGLANIITALLFIVTIFFYPLVQTISSGCVIDGITYYPVIAPALILVGNFMLTSIQDINWKDFTESFLAFLTIVIIALSFSITEGIVFGFVFYTLLKTCKGKFKEIPPIITIFAFLFILRYIFLK